MAFPQSTFIPKPAVGGGEASTGARMIPRMRSDEASSMDGGDNTEQRAQRTRAALEFASSNTSTQQEQDEDRLHQAATFRCEADGDSAFLKAALFGEHEVLREMLRSGDLDNKNGTDAKGMTARDLVEMGRKLVEAGKESGAAQQEVCVEDFDKSMALLNEYGVLTGAEVVEKRQWNAEFADRMDNYFSIFLGVCGLICLIGFILFTWSRANINKDPLNMDTEL